MKLRARRRSRRVAHELGVSLVEVLVVLGVLGVLMALAAPSLFRTRDAARSVVSLANLRDTGVSFELYTQANAGRYPFLPAGAWMHVTPPDEQPEPGLQTSDPWALSFAWPVVMHSVAPWREHYALWVEAWQNPRDGEPWFTEDRGTLWPIYSYSRSFLASPRVWGGESAGPVSADDISGTHVGDVAHPSDKVILFHRNPGASAGGAGGEPARPILFADGAAVRRFDRDARLPAQNRLRDQPPALFHDTPDGVRGRDF